MTAPQSFRLSSGGRIDRSRTLRFTCNGRELSGFEGDTLASALLANGVRVVGRSFKRHRPRGVMSAGIEETNALFRVDVGPLSRTLVRATLEPLVDRLTARSENAFPSVDFDLGRIVDFTRALWPAGFYNKTFIWPHWHWYEGFIRRAAGLGRLPGGDDTTRYYEHNLHCEVLVVGAGAAGLSAALAAARQGARVLLVEQDVEVGGRLLADRMEVDGISALHWVTATRDELYRTRSVRILTGTTVVGYYDHNVLTAIERSPLDSSNVPIERFWKIRADRVVLTTGAIEQPLVFSNNDRPGILLAGAVRQYLQRYGVTPGRTVVVATNNDDAYQTAFALQDAGISVPAIIDAREEPDTAIRDAARQRALKVHANAVVTNAAGTRGVRRVAFCQLDENGHDLPQSERQIDCDTLAMSGGWNPSVHLFSQAGGQLKFHEPLACFVPHVCRQDVQVAGAVNGDFSLAEALERGAAAGAAAARHIGPGVLKSPQPIHAASPSTYAIRRIARPPTGARNNQWIDFLHDVTVADVELAVRENFVSVEHLKRYTTTGMAIDQGKTSNLNALSLLAALTNRGFAEVGTTTFRPQFMPVPLGAIAAGAVGDLFAPARLLPAHEWHIQSGGQMTDYGTWKRPACYLTGGEDRPAAIAREVGTVRNAVGMFDGSPLGKIEVRGPDAADFINRIYVQNGLTLGPGKVRYGLMLNENGVVIDDGVFACLRNSHYLVNTTSGNAERIAAWFDEWHQCEWPDLQVVIAPVTSQWAVLTLAGPRARDVLGNIESDIEFSATAFPHLSIRSGQLAGMRARVQRVSFTGEMTFEISVPARRAAALCELLMRIGAPYGIEPVGIEAILMLRLEKGFLHVGTDTDGTTNPLDIGFGRVVENKHADFVGRRSLLRPADRRDDRRQFVGIEPRSSRDRLVSGAHFISSVDGRRRSEGFVTSACLSPTLGRSIGLGLLERGSRRKGETVTVFNNGHEFPAIVVEPAFYDPRGTRMHD